MRLNRLLKEILFFVLLAALPGIGQAQGERPSEPDVGEQNSETGKTEDKDKNDEKDGPTLDERLDALLSEVSVYEEGEPQRCLNTRAYRTVKVLNTEYLLFSRGSRYWLNKLKRDCPSLKFNDLPVFESRGSSSLCENDPFYPSNSMDIQRGLSGGRPVAMQGTCYLGSFQPISAEQAALLSELK